MLKIGIFRFLLMSRWIFHVRKVIINDIFYDELLE